MEMEVPKNEESQVPERRQLRKRPSTTPILLVDFVSFRKLLKTTNATAKRTPSKSSTAQPDNTVIEIIDPLRNEKAAPGVVEEKPPTIEEQPSAIKPGRGRKKKASLSPLRTIEDIKSEPTRWLKLPVLEMKTLIRNLWGDGPYPCFAITKKKCSTFSTIDEAVKHNKKCIKPMYMTYAGDRLPLFHALPKAVKQRYVRETIAVNNEIICHTCGKISTHVYGMVYHLERCGIEIEKQPWKCWRCGLEATAGESRDHLKGCKVSPQGSVDVEGRPGEDATARDSDEYVPEGAAMVEDETEMGIPKMDTEFIEHKAVTINSNCPTTRRRTTTRPSVSTGILPPESSRVRVANTGQPRYKFRRTEISKLVADMSGWQHYKSKVEQSMHRWEQEHIQPLPTALSVARNDSSVVDISPKARTSKSSVGFHFRDNTLAYISTEKLPDDLNFLKVFESTSKEADESAPGNWVTIGYTGGPIHTMKFAPNRFSEDEEVLMTVNYNDDDTLLTENWKDCSGIIDLWIVKHGQALEKASTIKPWFTLESKYGAILSACWLDVPRLENDESLIGFIALSTGQGIILIYRIDLSSAPSDSNKPSSISPEPLVILRQEPPIPESNGVVQEIKYSPPITRIDWSAFENSRYLAGISAVGSVLIWDLEGNVNCPSVLFNSQWASPACDLCFCKDHEMVVAFREKCIRVYDLRTWALLLEENTVRTAGIRVTSCQRALSGFVTFQSEYFNTAVSDVPCTGIHYVCSDDMAKGYFVVPLANRHDLQMWDASIHSTTAIIASCGVDGQLLLSGNGLVVPRLSKVDTQFSVARESMLLSKRRIEELNDEGDAKLLESLYTHESVCEKTWLEISLKPKKGAKNVPYSSLELRTESLNVVATNSYSKKPIAVTGGQAGLLFIRPCRLDIGGNTIDPLELISSLTTPSKNGNVKGRKQTQSSKKQSAKQEAKTAKEENATNKESAPKVKKAVTKNEPGPPPVKKERPSRTKKDR